MPDDRWQIIDKRQKTLRSLYMRMDETRDLAYLTPFKLRDFNDKHDLDNVLNVTGNQPAVFAHAIISDLQTATWQTVVEGDISQRQAGQIEQFIEDNFEQADEMLLTRFGIPSLYDWLCNHVCLRSLIGVRWLGQVDDGTYEVDCLPVDMRWTPYRAGTHGLLWVAPISWRASEDLEDEFPPGRRINGVSVPQGEEVEVRDYWGREVNEVWVERRKIFEQKNTLGYPPFVILLPPSGFMLRDKEYLKHEAEDIFFLNRALYKEMNRALSIEQTIGMDVLYPPYEYETENFDSRPARQPPKSGQTQKVPQGERHQPVPRGDLNRASLTAREDIYKMIELGGISDAELGSARLDRPGIWFAKQFEIRQKLEKSRFQALSMMKEGLARMMIEQFLATVESDKEPLHVGKTGRKNRFSAQMLGDPDSYRISFRVMVSTKEQEIVNLAQAQAARGIVPDRIIVRDILKAEDPASWEREMEMQRAREANPAIGLAEMAVKFAEEAEDTEDEAGAELKKWQSMMLVHEYVMMMKARMQPQQSETGGGGRQQSEAARGNLQGLASLPRLLQGGSGGAAGPRVPTPKSSMGMGGQ